jgi:hypothetical protein
LVGLNYRIVPWVARSSTPDGRGSGAEAHQVRNGLSVEEIIKEFKLETLRDYLSRSAKMRDEHLRAHPKK